MASVGKELFDSPDWIFEPKLDGYRAIAVTDSTGKARLWSRNRLPLESKFPTIGDALRQLKLRSTILDGEIVALDKDGILGFNCFNNGRNARPLRLCFSCSTCFGTMRVTLPARRSYNGVTDCSRSSLRLLESRSAVISRIVESIFSGLFR